MLKKYRNLYIESQSKSEHIKIFLVSNIREKTSKFKDYDKTSVISEYLSLTQQELIVDSLRNSGFETVCFTDEMDFINNYITNNYYSDNSKFPIVLNTAQKEQLLDVNL